jgi:hypothetical protein
MEKPQGVNSGDELETNHPAFSVSILRFVLHPAITRLLEMHELLMAVDQEAPRDIAEFRAFGIPIGQLARAGLDSTAIRWMVLKGYGAYWDGTNSNCLGYHSAMDDEQQLAGDGIFWLTLDGARVIRAMLDTWTKAHSSPAVPSTNGALNGESTANLLGQSPAKGYGALVPKERNGRLTICQNKLTAVQAKRIHWDRTLRELWLDESLVKRFSSPAINQELILSAFEEEGWPPHIDDPLPPVIDIDPKLRLRDTISSLNRHQLLSIIRFHGDGRGTGIRWEVLNRE